MAVNIGSENGLLSDGTKPLPEPMLTDIEWGVVAPEGNFKTITHQIYLWYQFDNDIYNITAAFLMDQWVNFL